MAAFYPVSQHRKALLHKFMIVKILIRACNPICQIHMHGKPLPVHLLQQPQILLRTGWYHPGHRFQRIIRPLRHRLVDNILNGTHRLLPVRLCKILLVSPIPPASRASGYIDAARRANPVCQLKLPHTAGESLTPHIFIR